MRFFIGVLTFTLFLFADSINAKVYKWVDENGKTHYSDKPIDDKSKEIKVKKGPSAKRINDAKQRTKKQLNAYKRLSESVEKEKADKAKLVKQQEQEAQETRAECKEARRLVNVYNRGRPVFQRDENGNKVYLKLSDDDKNEKIAVLNDFIKKKCL
jgi:hypothetical protein